MKEQQTAEAYVREQRPALMELTFGCEVACTYKPNKSPEAEKERTRMIMVGEEDRDDGIDGGLYNFVRNLEYVGETTENSEWWKIVEIIGHPINLQDWLAVLGELEEGDPFCVDCWGNLEDINRLGERLMHFNLTTGQPATQADFKAFNDIVNI